MSDSRFLAERLVAGLVGALVGTLAVGVVFPEVSVLVPPFTFMAGVVTYHVLDADTDSIRRRLTDSRAQSGDPRRTAKAAAGIVSTAGLAGLVEQYVLGGVIYQTGLSLIGAIEGASLVFLSPFRAFGSGLGELVGAIVESPISIIEQSADYTAFSITAGEWGIFGPLTFAVGVAATLAGLWVATTILRRLELHPWRLFRGQR